MRIIHLFDDDRLDVYFLMMTLSVFSDICRFFSRSGLCSWFWIVFCCFAYL